MTEVILASVIAMIILMAVAAALTSGIVANRTVKGNQQATAYANRLLEDARNREFSLLVLDQTTLAGSPEITSCAASPHGCYKPDAKLGAEPIEAAAPADPTKCATDPLACPIKHVDTITDPVVGFTYTIRTYITRADWNQTESGFDNRTRRVTVIASYKRDGANFSAKASTVITQSRRGLPEPKFNLDELSTAGQRVSAETGDIVFETRIDNHGIVDTYDIDPGKMTSNPSWWRTPNVTFWHDVDGDGKLNRDIDKQITEDTNGNGLIDTGSIKTEGSARLLVVYTIRPNDTLGSTGEFTVQFQSGAFPSVHRTATYTGLISAPFERYYLYNHGDYANEQTVDTPYFDSTQTTVPFPMPMNTRAPGSYTPAGFQAWNTLRKYGLGHPAMNGTQPIEGPGRPLLATNPTLPATGAYNASTAPYVAAWDYRFDLGLSGKYGPYWHSQLYVANAGSAQCTDPITLRMYLIKVPKAGAPGGPQTIAQTTQTADMTNAASTPTGCMFQRMNWSLVAVPNFEVLDGETLRVRLVVDNPTRPATAPVLISYGVNTDSAGPDLGVTGRSFTEVTRRS